MRPIVVATLFQKELRETIRDWRTLFVTLLMPIVLYPMLFIGLGQIVATEQLHRKTARPVVAIWGPMPGSMVLGLQKEVIISESRPEKPPDPETEARRTIRDGKADLVIGVGPDALVKWTEDASVTVDFFYDKVVPASDVAHSRVLDVLDDLRKEELAGRLKRRGLPERFEKPLYFEHHDLATEQQRGGDFAGRVLPFILLLMTLLGAFMPAIDAIAGEKERGTMQTLLSAPIRPVEIVAGKYFAVVAVAIASAAVNLASMGLALARQVAALSMGSETTMAFSLSPSAFGAVFLALLPMACLGAGILMLVAAFARSFREAQNYLTPVLLGVSLPAILATMPSMELTATTAFVPVANIALLIRNLLRGQVSVGMYGIVFVANAAYAAMAVLAAARVFESEEVVLGGGSPWRDLLRRRRTRTSTPSPGNAVMFVAVLVVISYYGTLFGQPARFGVVGAIVFVELLLFLLPPILWTAAGGFSFKDTFFFRLPRGRAWAGILAMAAGGWSVGRLAFLGERWAFPDAVKGFEEMMTEAFGPIAPLSLPGQIALVALLPALAEEACCRGVVLSGLARSRSRWIAVVGSAVAFGLLHLHPIHIVVATAIGLLLGFATLETRSILASFAIHFANNGFAVVSSRVPAADRLAQSPVVLIGALVLTGAGSLLVRRKTIEPSPSP